MKKGGRFHNPKLWEAIAVSVRMELRGDILICKVIECIQRSAHCKGMKRIRTRQDDSKFRVSCPPPRVWGKED